MKRSPMWYRLLAVLFASALVASACGSDVSDAVGDVVDTAQDGAEAVEDAVTDDDEEEAMADDEEAMEDDEEAMEDEEPTQEETGAVAPTQDEEEAPAPEAADDGGNTTGTLIWAHEQEPPDMHLDDPNNNLSITSWIRSALIEGLYGVDGSTSYYPELLAEEGVLTENADGSVNIAYTLRDGLQWSDGAPLTTADVEYTYNILTEGCDFANDDTEGCVYLTGSHIGIELITAFNVTSDTEFNMDLESFFAGWKGLLSEVYAAHAFGADAAEVNANLPEWANADGTLPSSGPMLFGEWDRGISMTMTRNDAYHGSNSPDARNDGPALVDGVAINFVTDTDAQINALKAGEAHIIMTQPQLQFADRLATDENFTVASSAGPVFEHWGLNLLNPHLSDPLVREALLYAMDKTEVMAGLYTPLFGSSLPAEGLGGVYWLSNQPDYIDFQAAYTGSQPDAALANLEAAGYSIGGDGIAEHPERGRLTLRVGTTGGNGLRELQQQIIQAQMAPAGIEVEIDNVPGGAYFGERPFSEAALAASASGGAEGDPTIWDITQFAWVGGPWPGGQTTAFLCGSGNNPYGFCNEDFDALAAECDATVDTVEQAACYNQLSEWVTTLNLDADNGMFMLPLTQKPAFYGYLSSVLSGAGVAPDAQGAGPLANVVDFQFK